MLNIYEFVKVKGIWTLYKQNIHRNLHIMLGFTLKKVFFFLILIMTKYIHEFFQNAHSKIESIEYPKQNLWEKN